MTWITDDEAPATVDYGTEEGKYSESSTGSTHVYSFATYTSGKIHEVVIGPLDPDTVYFYRCGGNPGRELSFKTPPAGLPIKFTIVGNLTSILPSMNFDFLQFCGYFSTHTLLHWDRERRLEWKEEKWTEYVGLEGAKDVGGRQCNVSMYGNLLDKNMCDLGQTGWTSSTLDHVSKSNSDILLLPGDLSYADLDQSRWDSFGRLVEPLASSRPWMVTEGNHEIETIPLIESTPFKPYNARWHMPYEESASPSNLFYSFGAAGGSVHVLMLGSYADFAAGSDQFKWLQADLAKLDRSKTPWLFALIHAPWYNSNKAHHGEGKEMRAALEELLYAAGVDAVFAGHVHAYERFTSVYDKKEDRCGAVHITVGDGGNREGLASKYKKPQPSMSLFREASFGHGQLYVQNSTHALWSWHRNDDDEAMVADSVWITSLASNPSLFAVSSENVE
ncbi:Purple acid phosphatase 22 [Platanthera guangdongensis]|uniref:Purple acid phosphatase n=1 Tax=Platanthera guangdongensis TaxID=2320717 RepID=A0ABR2N1Z9_9ASPA